MPKRIRGTTKKKKLFKRVQREHLKLLKDPETANLPFSKRDEIVGKKVRRSAPTVSHIRKGLGAYKKFRNLVDSRLFGVLRKPGDAEQTFLEVQRRHLELALDPEHNKKSFEERDKLVAKQMSKDFRAISESTVGAARVGRHNYTDFASRVPRILRGESRIVSARARFNIVQKEHLKLLGDPKYANLSLSERDKIVADNLGLEPNTVNEVRCARNNYAKYAKLLDPRLEPTRRNSIKTTFWRVQYELAQINKDSLLKLLDVTHKDELIAARLGLGQPTVSNARKAVSTFKKFRSKANPEYIKDDTKTKSFLRIMHTYETLIKHPVSLGMTAPEQDKFVAGILRFKEPHVQNARLALATFKGYLDKVPPEMHSHKYRSTRETFESVQAQHANLSKLPQYKNLELSELDGVVANRLGIAKNTASNARRGVREFQEFINEIPEYLLAHSPSTRPPGSKHRLSSAFDKTIDGISVLRIFDAIKSATGDIYFSQVLTSEQRAKIRENFALVLNKNERKEFHNYWLKRFPKTKFDSIQALKLELKKLKEGRARLNRKTLKEVKRQLKQEETKKRLSLQS